MHIYIYTYIHIYIYIYTYRHGRRHADRESAGPSRAAGGAQRIGLQFELAGFRLGRTPCEPAAGATGAKYL